jgi:hypothetical protein
MVLDYCSCMGMNKWDGQHMVEQMFVWMVKMEQIPIGHS